MGSPVGHIESPQGHLAEPATESAQDGLLHSFQWYEGDGVTAHERLTEESM